MPATAFNIFDAAETEAFRRNHQLDPEHIRRFRNRLMKRFLPDSDVLSESTAFSGLACHVLELAKAVDSSVDGATRLLFRTDAGMLIESVILRIATGRTTLCVSSQVGCAAACDFCATGKMGIARNLSSAEILDQVVQAGQRLAQEGRTLNNIVFMGMGEPFHNEETLHEVLSTLVAPRFFARSPSSLLVSTVGIPEAMLRCAKTFPQIGLALSLHSANQSVRESLIPLASKYPLDELRDTMLQLNDVQQRSVMVEYLMLKGVNDSPADADQLVEWLTGLDVHANLIPYNEIEDAPHLQPTEREEIQQFADRLKAAGLKTTVRYSLGSDIAAACGQLVRMENRHAARSQSEPEIAESQRVDG